MAVASQITITARPSGQATPMSTPAPVATPLPPSNRSQGVRVCPSTAARPASAARAP